MATKKLSEALAELQKAASVEGLDVRLVVAGNSSTDNAKTITLQQLLTALNVPTVQNGYVGNNQQYIYSVSTDNTHAVMSGTFKAFQSNGQCLIRHKFWGSTNDYNDGQYTTREIPKVTTSANGVFEAAMLVRLLNTTLTEVNSTTDKVVVSYPNYANGSTKSLEISKATTAKAGVMTAEQVKQLQDLVNNPTSGSAQYLKWDSANHKYTYVATEAESDAVIPIASATQNGLMSKENSKSLSDIQTNYKDFGHFASKGDALSKITELSVCADSNIVHAHMTYANGSGKTTLILIQSIDENMCRQIIYNKMKVFHRTITFTDANRTAIQTKEDWMFLFGDRLVWSTSGNKYVLSQFGNGFGHSYCSPIPTATSENDGLMSISQVSDLKELKKTAKRKKTTKFPPCVHKAIPFMPKKGRTYYNSRGHFHFDIKKDILEKSGIDFTYVDNVIGSLVGIKILGPYVSGDSFCVCLSTKKGNDLTKYYHINKDNWRTLFGQASKVQFEVSLVEDTLNRYILEILSDEEVIFSNKFKFKLLPIIECRSHETSSPFWVIEGAKVSYIRPITNNYLLSSDNAKAFYYKACKKKKTINGERVSVKKRWKRVSKNTEGYNNIEFNRRAFKFRVYPCYKKWRRTIINKGSFVEVLRDNNCNIKKILP